MKFVFSEKNGQRSLDRFDSIGGLLKEKTSFVISVEDCSVCKRKCFNHQYHKLRLQLMSLVVVF